MESESSADDTFAGEEYEQLDDWDEDEFVTEEIADSYSIEEEAESYW